MFVRGGVVWPGDYLDDAGDSGYYRSSVGRIGSDAYALYFTSGLVYPSVTNSRYFGLPVRCVALGG